MAFETINLGTQPAGTGGDTARSAFEKTNRNFLAAEVLSATMSQAQFEAIRAQNKERYAASGWVSFGNHESGKQVNECKPGLYTSLTTPNTLLIGKAGGVGGSKTDHGVLCIAGVIFHLPLAYPIRLAQAPDGKTTYNKSTGVITNHATVAAAFNAQAADPVNVEVVINRVDMWGFEAFPQEVTPANPEIYPQGVFSDLFTSMNGIPTSDSARPVSYFGFLGKKAKKVDFFALSDAQKKKVLADPKNNLYYSDDGRLIQWVLRGREFAGSGNGDWKNVDSTFVDALVFSGNARAQVQGTLDSVTAYTSGFVTDYVSKPTGVMFINDTGTFGVRGVGSGIAVNGECYFIVCGTVNRLNQGAYHPSFNFSGACNVMNSGGGGNTWYATNQASLVTSTHACFELAIYGAISSSISGRPDGCFHDAIYADGQGGVCRDMRYSAYGVDSVDFAEADQKVKNGTYRGFEKLLHTKFTSVYMGYLSASNLTHSAYNSGPNASGAPLDFSGAGMPQGTPVIVHQPSSGITLYGAVSSINGYLQLTKLPSSRGVSDNDSAAQEEFGTTDMVYIAVVTDMPYSVGGSFLQTDVIGNPENILATPALANGWQGSWVPTIPDGTNKDIILSRKSLSSTVVREYTLNNGASWDADSSAIVINSQLNGNLGLAHGGVQLWHYQAFAKQTENAVNAAVYGGAVGVGSVAAVRVYDIKEGSLLQESLIGKVNTDNTAWLTSVNLISLGLSSKNTFISYTGYYSRHPVSMFDDLAPSNDSPAVKALNYNVNLNQQAFIQYAYTELKHNGTNWGDDGKVTIVDNQSTKTDLNGNTVLVGTAKLKEPIGWIKNKV
ncbi:hypothetical protein [Shewanella xiamenensis]|uniref:hypothetical protein n=1 Tax=Shewanella xiamenensis TaxID=332186 RepID=UPI00313A92F2